MRHVQIAIAAVLSLTALTACRTSTDAKVQAAVAETAMTSSSQQGMTQLTDHDAAAVARTINDGEIQMAQVALASAQSPRVREFAQMMIDHHTSANTQLQTNGYGMAPNPVTAVLNAEVNRRMTMLRGMSGTNFDRAYIADQVDMHMTALETIRTSLLPSAREQTLQATMRSMRETVESHLQQAREIQAEIGGRP